MLPLTTVEPEEEGARRVLGFAFSRGGLDWDTLSKVLSFFFWGGETAMIVSGKEAGKGQKLAMDAGKYVRYTPEQVEALERVYNECPKPSSLKRQQLIRECPILSNIDPKQIKVWFQNRR